MHPKQQQAREIIEEAIAKLRAMDPGVTIMVAMIPFDDDAEEPDCCFSGMSSAQLMLASALFVHALEAAGKKATMVDISSGQSVTVPGSYRATDDGEFDGDIVIEEK